MIGSVMRTKEPMSEEEVVRGEVLYLGGKWVHEFVDLSRKGVWTDNLD